MGSIRFETVPGNGIPRYVDDRSRGEAEAVLAEDDAALGQLHSRQERLGLRQAAGLQPDENVDVLVEHIAEVGRHRAAALHRLRVLDEQDRVATLRRIEAQRIADIERELGFMPVATTPVSLEAQRNAAYELEQAERAARPPLSKEEVDRLDPHSEVGKRLALQELNLRDPRWRAQHGLDNVDAIVALHNGEVDPRVRELDAQREREAVFNAKEERRSWLAAVRDRLSR